MQNDVKYLRDSSRWNKNGLLGRGKFEVYSYTHVETKSKIAVKEVKFKPGDKQISSDVKIMQNEIEILRKLSHHRIITYFGADLDDSTCIISICMEYMPGGSLSDRLQDNPLDLETTIMYTLQLLEGVIYLHNERIVHRDIKGSNILIDDTNNIKLADFGISKCLTNLSSISGAKTNDIGTTKWMAPEVIKENAYGFKVDIWSVGCTVVEMLTSKPPWHGLNSTQTIIAQSKETYPIYTLPAFASNVEHFLQQCFKKNPMERPTAENLFSLAKNVFDNR